MVWVETTLGSGDRTPAGAGTFPGTGGVRLCRYRVPASEQRSGKPAGQFVAGGILAKRRWTAIATAVRAAGPARRCATPAGEFALLRHADDTGGELYVELDGCRRIMWQRPDGPPSLAQADDALIALLTAKG
jgi:hypothetical protein